MLRVPGVGRPWVAHRVEESFAAASVIKVPRGMLIEFLKAQVYRDRLPARLPRTTIVAHKTGDMAGVENDAGILYLPAGPVVAAVFTNELASDVEGRLAIQEIGRAIYDAGCL